jgi:hypothetical protein
MNTGLARIYKFDLFFVFIIIFTMDTIDSQLDDNFPNNRKLILQIMHLVTSDVQAKYNNDMQVSNNVHDGLLLVDEMETDDTELVNRIVFRSNNMLQVKLAPSNTEVHRSRYGLYRQAFIVNYNDKSIVLAHRLENYKHADDIVVISFRIYTTQYDEAFSRPTIEANLVDMLQDFIGNGRYKFTIGETYMASQIHKIVLDYDNITLPIMDFYN